MVPNYLINSKETKYLNEETKFSLEKFQNFELDFLENYWSNLEENLNENYNFVHIAKQCNLIFRFYQCHYLKSYRFNSYLLCSELMILNFIINIKESKYLDQNILRKDENKYLDQNILR